MGESPADEAPKPKKYRSRETEQTSRINKQPEDQPKIPLLISTRALASPGTKVSTILPAFG